MKQSLKNHKIKLQFASLFLILGALTFAVIAFGNSGPFIQDLDPFVLVAENLINLEKEVQISSGDIASNNKLDIDKENILNSNLFSDKITIKKNSSINGNATYNKLKLEKDAQILGTQNNSVALPIVELPDIPDFEAGTQSFVFQEDNNTLSPGPYEDIKLKPNSTLILEGGTYNLRSLRLEKHSILIFNSPTAINIQEKLTGDSNIAILPGQALNQNDLQINFKGENLRNDKVKDRNFSFIHFGKNSFLNFKLLAPNTTVRLGKQTTFRGQILADEIFIGKGSVLSRESNIIKETDPTKVIIDEDGSVYPINEIIVNFKDEATFLDAQKVADLIDGQIIGFMQLANAYQIEVFSETPEELKNKIELIENASNPLVEGVFENFSLKLE